MKLPVPTRFRSGTDSPDAPDRAPDEPGSATVTPPPSARPDAPEKPKKARGPKKPKGPKKAKGPKRPLYARLLHLRHIAPNAWQRAALGEGSLAVAIVLVLADLATAWTLLVLPLAVAAVVKAHDLLAWLLGRPAVPPPAPKKKKAAAPQKQAAPLKEAAPTQASPQPPVPDARTAPPPKEWRRR